MNGRNKNSKTSVSRREFLGATAAVGAGLGLPFSGAADQAVAADNNGKPKMKIFIFSKHLQWLDYKGMAEAAAQLGFDGTDLTVRPGGHVLPERVRDDLPRAVEEMKKAGLEVGMMVTKITDSRDRYTQPVLETASKLGFRYYRTGGLKYDAKRPIPDQLADFQALIRDLAAMNRQYNIHGAYQNHAGSNNVGAPLWDLWQMVKDLDRKWMGCQFDIRHATVEGGLAWPINFRLIAPHVITIIAKDFRWTKTNGDWKVVNCPLGEGMVDFPYYFKQVKKAQIPGPISLHLEYPLADGKPVLDAMRKDLAILKRWLCEANL